MEGTFYQPKRTSPTAIAVVVLMHGAAITALALSKIDVAVPDMGGPDLINIFVPQEPPPEPPPPVKQRVELPRHQSVVEQVIKVIPTPSNGPAVQTQPFRPVEIEYTRPAVAAVAPPPPAPPARKLEPARARANLASYVSNDDYPASAIRSEEQGVTKFRLAVGPNGRVTDCTVTGSSGSTALDSATCRLMKSRARFTPARDSDGRPTSDQVSNAIRWVLPDE
jgi:protein TonB